MDQLSLKQLCQCHELWSTTSCFNTSRVKRKDFAPSADSFSLCFNRTEINDVHLLWQTHRVTLRSFTKGPAWVAVTSLFLWISSPSPTARGRTRPTPPLTLHPAAAVSETSVTAVTLQASNKARSLWIRWKTQKSELIISHEGVWRRNYVLDLNLTSPRRWEERICVFSCCCSNRQIVDWFSAFMQRLVSLHVMKSQLKLQQTENPSRPTLTTLLCRIIMSLPWWTKRHSWVL